MCYLLSFTQDISFLETINHSLQYTELHTSLNQHLREWLELQARSVELLVDVTSDLQARSVDVLEDTTEDRATIIAEKLLQAIQNILSDVNCGEKPPSPPAPPPRKQPKKRSELRELPQEYGAGISPLLIVHSITR